MMLLAALVMVILSVGVVLAHLWTGGYDAVVWYALSALDISQAVSFIAKKHGTESPRHASIVGSIVRAPTVAAAILWTDILGNAGWRESATIDSKAGAVQEYCDFCFIIALLGIGAVLVASAMGCSVKPITVRHWISYTVMVLWSVVSLQCIIT